MILFSLLCFSSVSIAKTQTEKSRFPTVQGNTLAKNKVNLPKGFPGERTIVLLAFQRSHQHAMKTWKKFLRVHCNKGSSVDFMNIPVMGGFAGLFRYFILRGMRKSVKQSYVQQRFLPLFISQSIFVKALRLKHKKDIVVLLTDRKGTIYGKVRGAFSAEKGKKLKALLEKTRKHLQKEKKKKEQKK